MLSRVDADEQLVVSDQELERTLESFSTRDDLERGGLDRRGQAKDLVVFGRSSAGDIFPGYSWRERRDGRRERRENGVLCHSAIELQSVVGCPFDCTYCPYTAFVCVRLDVEDFVDRAAALAQSRRTQSVFKLNNRSDTLGLEPEYGLAPAMVRRFSTLPGKYLMLYSKGDNVDGLLDLDHRGHTIACFTLTPESVAEHLENRAPSLAARLEAIAKLSRAGYPIRVRFSPVVPVRGWRAAYAQLVKSLFAVAQPELITLWTLSMIDVEQLERIVPAEAIDPEALAMARSARERLAGAKGAPFPEELRADLYTTIAGLVREANPQTSVSLCLENEAVWDRVGPLVVPRKGGRFLCNCGPTCSPRVLAGQRRGHCVDDDPKL